MEDKSYNECGLMLIQKMLGGKWKIIILWALSEKTRRFSELQKLFPDITQAMLTKQLREMEQYNFVHREVYREVPPKVEYSLTDFGRDFSVIIKEMHAWGEKHYESLQKLQKNYIDSTR